MEHLLNGTEALPQTKIAKNDTFSLLRSDLSDYEGASNLAFNDMVKGLQKQGHKIYHFGFGQSPFPIPEVFVEALKKYAGRHEYLPVAGIPALREKILRLHRIYDGLEHFDINSVILGAGSKELLFLVANIFGGEILLISPSWTSYYPQCKLAGRKVHILPTHYEDRFLVDPAFLEQFVAANCSKENYKLMVLNSPNNPTGVSYPTEWLRSITEVCRKHKILVLSDEIYGRLQYEGKHESIAKFYPEGTIVTSGFSKWSSAGGWRAGYALFPQELKQLYKGTASAGSNTFTCCPAPVQYALSDGLDHQDQLHDYVVHSRKILKAVGHHVHRTLNEAGAKSIAPEGGYYFMPDFHICKKGLEAKGILTGQQMCDNLLEDAKIALMPAGPDYLRPVDELTTRLCFVNFDGEMALSQSRSMGPDQEIDQQFLWEHCTPTMKGIQELVKWMNRNK